MKIFVYLFIFTAFSSFNAFADDFSAAFMPDFEQGSVEYFDKKTLRKRADLKFSLKKISNGGTPTYELLRNGSGDCDKYKQITWSNKAQMEEIDGFLYTQHSTCSAKDKNGQSIITYKKVFDYEKKKIYWSSLDSKGKVIKKATFPIKGKTTDDVTLIYFLKTYVANRDNDDYKVYYMLTNEPRLYKCKIRIVGEEIFELPIGNKKAVKLKLTGDMGIIDDILDKYVPHTYVWYEPEPPYNWLQYEGLETSISSANVIISLKEYSYENSDSFLK
jgi:hypothetical protein